VISPPLELGTIFTNPETKHLLRVQHIFTTEDDVPFYNVTKVNAFDVFTNLRMATDAGHPGCTAALGSIESALCLKE
jgi:hypothetical protein